MGYKSHAQRKAVWASKKDGGKGNPNKKSPAKMTPFKLGTKKKSKRKLEPEFENARLKNRITDPIHFDRKFKYASMLEVPETIEEVKKSIPKKEKSPAKLTKPKGDGLKRVTESGQRQKEVLSYIDKANKQMEDYKNKKFEAEFAAKAKMSEKKMYGGKQYVHTPTEDRGLAGPFKMKAKSPLMAKISASCKARAKKKFKVCPSAYASGWGVRCTQGKV